MLCLIISWSSRIGDEVNYSNFKIGTWCFYVTPYLFIYFIYLFVYLFIYLFISLPLISKHFLVNIINLNLHEITFFMHNFLYEV